MDLKKQRIERVRLERAGINYLGFGLWWPHFQVSVTGLTSEGYFLGKGTIDDHPI